MPARLMLLLRALVLTLWCASAWAQTPVLAVPALSAHVIDQTGTLDAAQRQALDARLAAFEQRKGSQLVVLIVSSTAPEDIASYANRVGNAWKIGRREVGDGVLLIVAKNDRAVRIEVAKSLEGALPDLAAKRVIDQAIIPHLRQGDFAGGVQAGVEQLMLLIDRENLPAPSPTGAGRDADIDPGLLIFIAFAIVMLVLSRRRRQGQAAVSRGMHTGAWTGGGAGWSGGRSPSDSFGSFGSGGGGDFGGGGASGRW